MWPALSHHFGIHPPDVGLYSPAELARYVEAANEIAEEARKR